MRRDFLAGTIAVRGQAALHLQAQIAQLLFEPGDLLLLAGHRAVQLFEQIFVEAQLDFDFGKTCIHGNSRTYFALIFPLFSHYDDLDAVALHGLPGANFCGLAAFRPAVDCHFAIGHHMFTLPAAVGNAGELEQITKPDMFVLELKLADFHGVPDLLMPEHDTG
mgnify:CR=1 FL=1